MVNEIICHRLVGPEVKWVGDRAYCDLHHAKVTQGRASVWRVELGHILGLVPVPTHPLVRVAAHDRLDWLARRHVQAGASPLRGLSGRKPN